MSELNDRLIRVGITHGDFNGIGYETIIKTFENSGMLELCTPVVYGLHKAATAYRKILNVQDFNFFGIQDVDHLAKNHCNFINLSDADITIEPGVVSHAAGFWAVRALQRATDDLIAGKIDVLVTAPFNKNTVQSNEFSFPGHTEYLAQRAGEKQYLMLLISDKLRVGTVTGHIPIQEVAGKLSIDLIIQKVKVMNASLTQDFGITKPRIAVLGLNPHAGDNGLIGKEEQNIIAPAVQKLNDEGILAFGPYAADGFFGVGTWKKFDGVMAMYHDQGLIPFKSIAFHQGVNFTAGLPFVRTSPDHGTAYDIAGKNMADPDSLREAIYAGIDIFRNRSIHKKIAANPLQIMQKRERDRER